MGGERGWSHGDSSPPSLRQLIIFPTPLTHIATENSNSWTKCPLTWISGVLIYLDRISVILKFA